MNDRGSQRKYSMWPLFVLSLVALVDQVDMGIARGVLPVLEDEWGLSDFKLGLLGFSFIFVNTVATIPAGWMADKWRRNKVMGWTLVSWSGLILLSASAVNYWNLVFARGVMGIGQAVDDPGSTSLLGDYYPPRMRSRVFSAQQIAFFVGGGVGLGLGGVVATELGWRWAFALVGVPGSLIAFLVFRLREPVRGEADFLEHGVDPADLEAKAAELEAVEGPSPTLKEFGRTVVTDLKAELKVIFGIRTMRFILVGVSALLFTVSGIGYWLAVYHERYSDMTEKEAVGFTALVLAVGGGIGTVLGGWLSDRLAVKGGPGARITQVVWSAMGCSALFMISFFVPVAIRLPLQFLGVLSAAGAAPGLRAAMMDVLPADSRGVGASAFALCSAVLGQAMAPPLVGLLSDVTGSLVTAFCIVFPPIMIGLLLLNRAKTTIVEDAMKIFQSMMDKAQVQPAPPDPEPSAETAGDERASDPV